MTSSTYKTIVRHVRPTRAIVIRDDDDWIIDALGAMECSTRCWGGVAHVVLPTSEEGVTDPVVWKTVVASDPDVWAAYVRTGRDIERHRPDQFDQKLKNCCRVVEERNGPEDQSLVEFVRAQLRGDVIGQQIPLEMLIERAKGRSSPVWREEVPIPMYFVADNAPQWPFANVDGLDFEGRRIVQATADGLGPVVALLLAMRWGCSLPMA